MTSDRSRSLPVRGRFGLRAVVLSAGLLSLVVFRLFRPPVPVAEAESTFFGQAMGTTYSVRVVARPGASLERATVDALIRSRVEEVDRLMSTYDSASELSRFNRHQSVRPFPLSPPTLEVLAVARDVSERTAGAFDATVAPLVDAWGFGPVPAPTRVPTPEELELAWDRVGYEHVLIDPVAGTATKTRSDVVMDLSAIAKGYAVDRVADALEEAGHEVYMVEVGGEVRVGAEKPSGAEWRVALEAPIPGKRIVHSVVDLRRQAIATSGDYRNTRTLDGEPFAHIIDPRTGRAIPQRGSSVSVVHSLTLIADAWATALLVLGPDEGYDLASKVGVAALFLTRTDDEISVRATPSFPALRPPPEG